VSVVLPARDRAGRAVHQLGELDARELEEGAQEANLIAGQPTAHLHDGTSHCLPQVVHVRHLNLAIAARPALRYLDIQQHHTGQQIAEQLVLSGRLCLHAFTTKALPSGNGHNRPGE